MQLLIAGVQGTTLSGEERDLFRQIRPAGYILFARNIETCGQIRALTDELAELNDFRPIIGVDQEGGRVVRTRALGVEAPAPSVLAGSGRQLPVKMHAYWTAQILRQLGFNMNFAPVLDIAADESVSNALSGRCWGRDVNTVVSNAGAYASTLLKGDILTCGKHFPGLGRARVDPHFELPVVEADLNDLLQRDIRPFTALGDKWLSAIMCAHVFFPKLDKNHLSSLSRIILTDLLRNQLGYEGLILTDDLDMGAIGSNYGLAEAAAMAIEAGNDLAMVCHSHDRLADCAAAIDKLPGDVLDDRKYRVKDFLWKTLPPQAPFSGKLWEEALKGSIEFYAEYAGQGGTCVSSPVEEY